MIMDYASFIVIALLVAVNVSHYFMFKAFVAYNRGLTEFLATFNTKADNMQTIALKTERHFATLLSIVHQEEMEAQAAKYPITNAERAKREGLDNAGAYLKGTIGAPERA